MNKMNGIKSKIKGFLKRFDGKAKDASLLFVLGLVIVGAAWVVFHMDDEKNAVPSYATSAETKVARLLQEIAGVGEASVIVYEKDEQVESVVVVCEGANDLRVVMNIREAVASALGTEQKSVKIYLKKE